MNEPLRTGLIGAGMVSRHHLIAWAAIPDRAKVVAVADPSHDNAARRAGEFGIPRTYADAAAMLAGTEYQGAYNRTIAHFVTSLRDDTPFETAPQDYLSTLQLVWDCYCLSGWEASR
jgi:GFO/IDH/MocA oxidoreductase family protein